MSYQRRLVLLVLLDMSHQHIIIIFTWYTRNIHTSAITYCIYVTYMMFGVCLSTRCRPMCSSSCAVRPIASTLYTCCACSTTPWPCSSSTSPSTCSCPTSGPLAASSTGWLSRFMVVTGCFFYRLVVSICGCYWLLHLQVGCFDLCRVHTGP